MKKLEVNSVGKGTSELENACQKALEMVLDSGDDWIHEPLCLEMTIRWSPRVVRIRSALEAHRSYRQRRRVIGDR